MFKNVLLYFKWHWFIYPISSQVFSARLFNKPVELSNIERRLALFKMYACIATILSKCTYLYKGSVMVAPNHWLHFLKLYLFYLPEVFILKLITNTFLILNALNRWTKQQTILKEGFCLKKIELKRQFLKKNKLWWIIITCFISSSTLKFPL